jgi:UDP-GlcNAc:undecaprenyl-phosphate GlcNAc-1-phosphate transferase
MAISVTNLAFIYCIFFLCCIVFSILINALFLKFVRTLGIRNPVDGTVIRWGSQSKPAIGGISFYIIFLLSIAAYSFSISSLLQEHYKQFFGLLLASTLGFLLGLADDAYNTNPVLKFLAQLLCGVVLIITGTNIHLFNNEIFNYLITLLWVVGIMNSVNMLDNMDGVTSSVALIIVLGTLIVLCIEGHYSGINFIILVGMSAALIGFLVFNWPPSRIYMGDTGSQFLGVFLAAIGIVYFWNAPKIGPLMRMPFFNIVVPVLVFAIPIFDTSFVVMNRLRKKKSPFIGGKDHTTHRLAYLGFSETQIVLIVSGFSLISTALAIYLIKFDTTYNCSFFLVFCIYLSVILTSFIFICFKTLTNAKNSKKAGSC